MSAMFLQSVQSVFSVKSQAMNVTKKINACLVDYI